MASRTMTCTYELLACYKWHALTCAAKRERGTTTRAQEAEMLVQPRDGLVCAWTTAKVILLLSLSILSCIDVNHAQLDSHGRCMQ